MFSFGLVIIKLINQVCNSGINVYKCWLLLFYCFVCVDRNLYTIRAVPFTEVRSICRHAPAFGWQYIIVVLSSGCQIILALINFFVSLYKPIWTIFCLYKWSEWGCLFPGLAFPPLYFYTGGVREFLATIKQHVLLVRLVIYYHIPIFFSFSFMYMCIVYLYYISLWTRF